MNRIKSQTTLLAAFIALFSLSSRLPQPAAIAQAQSGTSEGSVGASGQGPQGNAVIEGRAGHEGEDRYFLNQVKLAKKQGLSSLKYLGSLIELGQYYNRAGEYGEGQKYLSKALAIIDGGALKPTAGSVAEGPPTIVSNKNGTTSATINKPVAIYEDMMEQLLPALVEADLHSNHLKDGEMHVKRFISMAEKNRVHRVPNLMFAYNQYAEILSRMHRPDESARFKNEADKINKSIRGL